MNDGGKRLFSILTLAIMISIVMWLERHTINKHNHLI